MKKLTVLPRRAYFLDGHRRPRLYRKKFIGHFPSRQKQKISLWKYPGERERRSFSHRDAAYCCGNVKTLASPESDFWAGLAATGDSHL
jgi:hypothetical protein